MSIHRRSMRLEKGCWVLLLSMPGVFLSTLPRTCDLTWINIIPLENPLATRPIHTSHRFDITTTMASIHLTPPWAVLSPYQLPRFLHVQRWAYNPPGTRNQIHNHDAAQARQLFPFFQLPLEVRDLIYDLLLRDFNFIFVHVNMKACASYKDVVSTTWHEWPPQCMLISKRFFAEALVQFHHMASFVTYRDQPWPLLPARPVDHLRIDHARKVRHFFALTCIPVYGTDMVGLEYARPFHVMMNNQASYQVISFLSLPCAVQVLDLHFTFEFPNCLIWQLDAADTHPWTNQFLADGVAAQFARLPLRLQRLTMTVVNWDQWQFPVCRRAMQATCHNLEQAAFQLIPSPRTVSQNRWSYVLTNHRWDCSWLLDLTSG